MVSKKAKNCNNFFLRFGYHRFGFSWKLGLHSLLRNLLFTFCRTSTFKFIVWAWSVELVSFLFNLMRKSALKQGALTLSTWFELIGLTSFCLGYVALWVLLLISIFRPIAEFSIDGFRRQRILNFAFVTASLVVIHIFLGFAVALAAS